MLSRYEFIKKSSTFLLDPFFYLKKNKIYYISAGADLHGQYYVFCVTNSDNLIYSINLPNRGHSIAINKKYKIAAVISRSPGTYIKIFDIKSGEILNNFLCLDGFHFYGHGFFSKNGRFLYVSENDFKNGKGYIGIYDSHNSYKIKKKYSTNGIGPHEIAILKNKNIAVIASGGIRTHPKTGKTKLNLQDMISKISFIDLISGMIIKENYLNSEFKSMSIRHLDVSETNIVAFAMQYKGFGEKLYPLVGICDLFNDIQLFDVPVEILYRMQNYCGSICFDLSGEIIAVSNPRGGIVTFWDVKYKKYLSLLEIADGCGLAPCQEPKTFCISNGYGQLIKYSLINNKKEIIMNNNNIKWDNHLVSFGNI